MNNELTVGELIEHLKRLPNTWPVYWYGNAAADSSYFYLSMPKSVRQPTETCTCCQTEEVDHTKW